MTTTAPKWSTVITAHLQRNRDEGTYSLTIYNADESEAQTIWLDAMSYRGAMLEATAWVKSQGWDPGNTTWAEDEDAPNEGVRRFRKLAG